MKFTVAIDGPAASGKGTIARAVAREFSFQHLDTGLLYRAVGAKAATGIDPEEAARTLSAADLEKSGLRSEAAGQAASKVAAIAEVRAHLLTFQQDFAVLSGGAILDGRDIGTVVCPDAEVKIFVTASDEVRAHRRWKEEGETGSLDAILADVRARDARDRERATSPLRPADDAIVLDTSHLSIEAAVSQAIDLVRDRLNG